ncbi:MAG: DUF4190 domain-containing protein [Nanoarchaeota archaeon]|nr:DUF4190 domain-containing protein [Nanoarchaeota archaeon]
MLGVLSIIFSFFTPFAGLIIGIVGLRFSGKQKTEMAKKANKLSKIGIVISIIMLIVMIVLSIKYNQAILGNLQNVGA